MALPPKVTPYRLQKSAAVIYIYLLVRLYQIARHDSILNQRLLSRFVVQINTLTRDDNASELLVDAFFF